MSNFDVMQLHMGNTGSEREEVAGGWRKLQAEELHN
jgi:hypothetical protein